MFTVNSSLTVKKITMITCIEFLSLHSHCNGCIFNMEFASLGMHGVNVIC